MMVTRPRMESSPEYERRTREIQAVEQRRQEEEAEEKRRKRREFLDKRKVYLRIHRKRKKEEEAKEAQRKKDEAKARKAKLDKARHARNKKAKLEKMKKIINETPVRQTSKEGVAEDGEKKSSVLTVNEMLKVAGDKEIEDYVSGNTNVTAGSRLERNYEEEKARKASDKENTAHGNSAPPGTPFFTPSRAAPGTPLGDMSIPQLL